LPVDAQSANPCRDVARISTKLNRPPTALTSACSDAFTNGWVSMSSRSSVILPTSRSAADQLGHAKPSLTAEIYMGRKKRATGAA
jgi:hypothetical protein